MTAKLHNSARSAAEDTTQFVSGSVPVAVYGLGKMGLPLAAVFADVCGSVIGVDPQQTVVETVTRGDCHVEREPGLGELVAETVADDALRATTDGVAAASAASVHVIIVPTLLTDQNEIDLSAVEAVCDDIAAGLDPGDMVLVESTVPPQTCREVIEPTLAADSDCEHGEFGVAFCPERTMSGRAIEDIRGTHPKIVGGIDAESTRVAHVVYEQISANKIVAVSDATTAETVKIFEGLYRDVNIALANELAQFTTELGIDVNEAISAANTQPFCEIHNPGPGVGGHCIPYYPYFLLNQLETPAPMLRTARTVNDEMPQYVVDRVLTELDRQGTPPQEATVAVVGLTYRPDVVEIRATPARPIVTGLSDRGVTVSVSDPLVTDDRLAVFGDPPRLDTNDLATDTFDGYVLVTPHEEFRALDWATVCDAASFLIDCHDTLDSSSVPCPVYTIGSGRKPP